MERRLTSYALAAGAAGVGLLALTQPVEAQIVYTPAHVAIRPGSRYLLDFGTSGSPELEFVDYAYPLAASLAVRAWYASFNKVEVAGGHRRLFVRALNRGSKIGASQSFYGCNTCSTGYSPLPVMAFANASEDFGSWVNVENRYVGIQFPIDGETHYGWARLSVRLHGIGITAYLTGYAYEATPNKPIRAGQTSSAADPPAVPPGSADPERLLGVPPGKKPISQGLQPAPLGLLALGSFGLGFWRRRKAPASSKP
ncbi:MAG TPA: hypothetical protein VI455_16055 [Terriglobia bacterium]